MRQMFYDKVGFIKVMVDGIAFAEFGLGYLLLWLHWEKPGGPLIRPVPSEEPITLKEWKERRQLVRVANRLD